MKNSLFKRAFAVAAVAPLALTQCLTVANAASINNADIAAVVNETVAASDKSITLTGEDGLAYINPGKEADEKDYYMVGEEALADIELTEDSYTITKDSTWNETVLGKIQSEAGKTGSFSVQDVLEKAAKKAGNYQDEVNKIIKHVGDVNYTIADNGDITLTCELSNIAPEFTNSNKVEIAGTFTAVIKASSLDDTKVEGTLTFVSSEGKEYKGTQAANYGLEKIAEVEAKFGTDTEYADALAFFKRQFNRVNTYTDKALAKTTEVKEYSSFDEALAAAKASRFGQKAEAKLKASIPSTAAEAAENSTVNDIYDKVVKEIGDNTSFTVDITTGQLADFAGTLYDITAQLNAGTATFSAKFTDDEKADVEAYLSSEYGLVVKDCYKTVDVTADYSGAKSGEGSVDVKVKRVVIAETTSSTTSTSTETETTSTDTETTSTDTETTTTDTETTTTDTETTPTETTTTREVKTVANYYVTSKTGFYLNIDEEFNKEQLESVYVSLDETEFSYGEDGSVVKQEVLSKGRGVNITDKVNFGSQTPANVFVKGDYKFSHEITLYAAEDITVDDAIITAAGAALTNADGSNAITIAYVGVKGDGDLNYMADAKDASLVLVWYAKMSTMDDPDARAAEVFSNSDQITTLDENGERVIREDYDKNLDQFAAFLCDTDNENAENNWYALKNVRKIDAKDASFIKVMYAEASTGTEPNRTSWNEVLGDFAKKAKTEE